MKKVCVVTGTRAEYGLLKPLLHELKASSKFSLQIVATGMHLSPEFGLTYRQIEKDGFPIDEKVEMLLSSDTPEGISKSMGLAMIGFSELLCRLSPDIVILLGDRYEMLAVASTCAVANIPVAHIHGGETTEGAFDEAFRHAITKMSWIHFTSTEEYRRRVIQLGENPQNVFNVGAIGIDSIQTLSYLSQKQLEKELGIQLKENIYLVTFHPVTLEKDTATEQFKQLLVSLDKLKDATIIFTKANADTDGRAINQLIDLFVAENKEKAVAFTSMGQLRYLSAMKISTAVVGNSSSGILEAPYMGIPTVNIGDRQKGRTQAESVINCLPITKEIDKALMIAKKNKETGKIKSSSLYGTGDVAKKIIDVLEERLYKKIVLKKSFYDIQFNL